MTSLEEIRQIEKHEIELKKSPQPKKEKMTPERYSLKTWVAPRRVQAERLLKRNPVYSIKPHPDLLKSERFLLEFTLRYHPDFEKEIPVNIIDRNIYGKHALEKLVIPYIFNQYRNRRTSNHDNFEYWSLYSTIMKRKLYKDILIEVKNE